MDTVFKWVHMSDIHFQSADEGVQTEFLRKKLSEYLKKEIQGCNALLLSGDYRYAPSGEENPKKCSDYIKSLAKNLGLANDQIVAVPGNHDLQRDPVRDCLIDGVQKTYDPQMGIINENIKKGLLSGFEFYYNLCDNIKGINSLSEEGPAHNLIHFEACDLLLLNTALIAGKDNESKQLVIGSSDIVKLLKDHIKGSPIIAIGHHSLSELTKDEQKMVEDLFSEHGICLYLCGHAHDPEIRSFGDVGKEITVGCIKRQEDSVNATFIVGQIKADGEVVINSHRWDPKEKGWFEDPPRKRNWNAVYDVSKLGSGEHEPKQLIEKTANPFSIIGYCLLGTRGAEGIKYFWSKNDRIVESVALNTRLKGSRLPEDNTTSAYTISSSIGCQLAATGRQCRFCGTGTMEYGGYLTAKDIALQCIFMAEYDSNCPSYPSVRNNVREFAFMGQGEPGLNYLAIRNAIILTDKVMERLEQKVSRYIISTCGIPEFIPALIEDIQRNTFKHKVTIHFSLHEIGETRKELMPIDSIYSHQEFITYCKALYNTTHEKIGVGILLFDGYRLSSGKPKTYTLTEERLKSILSCLDSNVFRIDLCAVNDTKAGEQTRQQSEESANRLLEIVKQKGFEGKLFSSFGYRETERAGCGMLASITDKMQEPGNKTIRHFNKALELLNEAEQDWIKEMQNPKK